MPAQLDFLKSKEESVSEPIIDEEVDGRTALKRKALRDLLAKGQIQRTGGGKRGDPFLYSCSLVPSIYAGQEKQETKEVEKAQSLSTVSRSQDFQENKECMSHQNQKSEQKLLPEIENRQSICWRCNAAKGATSLEEFEEYLCKLVEFRNNQQQTTKNKSVEA